jgi:hypothetical protein
MIKTDNIKSKLKVLGYKMKETQNEKGDVILKVYLPILCFLKIRFAENKIKITSGTYVGFYFYSLELTVIVYSLVLSLLLAYEVIAMNSVFTFFFLLFILYYLVCFVKSEFLRIIIIGWIEKELDDN